MFKKIISIVSFCFVLLTAYCLLLTAPVWADEGNLGAYPTNYDVSNPKTKSWFIYELKPEQTKEDSITVVNNSDKTVNVKVYAVDATTTSDGAFALLNEDQRQTDVGSWVSIAKDIITIEPRGRKDVPFTINIPKYATVGDHAGGIIIQEAKTANSQGSGIGLNIVSRVGTRIYETVPGDKVVLLDVRDLQYKISDDHLVFSFVMENKGNVILTPNGKLELKDYTGKVIDTIILNNLGSVFPGKPTTLIEKSNIKSPWFGKYNATVTINYSNTKAIAKSLSFFIYIKDIRAALPIPIAVILIVVLLFNFKKIFSHFKIAKKIVQKGITDLPKTAYAPAMEEIHKKVKEVKMKTSTKIVPALATVPENIDQLFIAHHLKLLAVFVSISIIVLSSLFGFMLQYFVLTKTQPAAQAESLPTQSPQQIAPTHSASSGQADTPIPTPTLVPISKSDMKIEVLNGGDTPGQAKTIGEKLATDGFIVIKTDNAPQDSDQTIIQYPVGQEDGANLLMEALAQDYSNIQKEEATDSSSFTIILGK